jgi:phage/plasmid-like protein (TIGR03299 family)
MAHELYLMADGTYSMARAANTEHSWHKKENIVDPNAPFEVWLDRSGMGFNINESTVQYRTIQGVREEMSSRKVLWRSDNAKALSIVGSEYKVVQPKEILSFFMELCRDNYLKMDTAGVIRDGRKFWALARTGNEFDLGGKDTVKDYILLGTSCDGTMATTAKQTSIRVVCSNTFHLAFGSKERIKVYHSSIFDKQKVKVDLGLTTENFSEFHSNAKEMHKAKIPDSQAMCNYVELMGKDECISVSYAKEQMNNSPKLQQLWGSYKNGKGAENTVWGWFNGVTYMVDHLQGRLEDTRINNSLFGNGNNLKQNAWKKAKEMAGV